MIYMITYDLKSPGQNYEKVIETIKDCSNGVWCTYWKSSFLIKSSKTVNQIFEKIQPHLDPNDKLLIIKVAHNYQGWLSEDEWKYINDMFSSDASL